uniref:Uncharacterized protein n=1 Tax=Anguilla anguilla TaxID=7936 RepID=A0A0E9X739_ANGAN
MIDSCLWVNLLSEVLLLKLISFYFKVDSISSYQIAVIIFVLSITFVLL